MSMVSKVKRPRRTEHSAGGIVFRRGSRGVEIAFILDSYRKWTFPKGRIKAGENIERAAVRESEEELGLSNLKLVRRLGKIEIWFIDRFEHKGELVHKYIYYVLLEAPSNARLKKPKRTKRGEIIRDVRFIPDLQALNLSSYKDIQPILKKAIRIIRTRPSI